MPLMGIRDFGSFCLALSPEETSSDTLPGLIEVQLRLKVTGLSERGLKSLIPWSLGPFPLVSYMSYFDTVMTRAHRAQVSTLRGLRVKRL